MHDQLRAVHEFVEDQKASVVAMTVFAPSDDTDESVDWINEYDETGCSVTWLEAAYEHLSGVQTLAVSDSLANAVKFEDSRIGCGYEAGGVSYCRLGGALLDIIEASREAQTRAAFDLWGAGLRIAGMNYRNVIRTWFYNDDILDWYEKFNRVRDDCYTEREVFSNLTPASTGVGVRNPFGAALSGELLAIKGEGVVAREIPSPIQCSAKEYGSSFSRAVEVETPGFRRLLISGTASIDANGATLHAGDVLKQIDCTMEAVGAILGSRGMCWADTTRATAYLKDAENLSAFHEYCAGHDLPPLPILTVQADICRSELLFELELDAATTV